MSVGFVMLAHTSLDRAAQISSYWATQGCPIVIHVDKRVDDRKFNHFKEALAEHSNILLCPRQRCNWGSWSIVSATQAASELLLAQFKEVRHIFLASGSCLPLRPIEELQAYLDGRPNTDFIESVATDEVDWIVGGLSKERFTLRFPFSWKTQRRLFDRYVSLQRRVGFRRKIPDGLQPYLGSQWWCLTRQTLSAILQDPRRDIFDRYFKRVWIPDESYFQSLARLYSVKIESRSLTLSKFDFQGKPHVFYDDHLPLLRKSDCFIARKIWPDAQLLYDTFLNPTDKRRTISDPSPIKIDRIFNRARERRTRGRPGLYMQGRFPYDWVENDKTGGRYFVFEGFTDLFEDFETWLIKRSGNTVHGRLFAKDKAHFANQAKILKGGLSDHTVLRDYDTKSFLTNLIWNARGQHQCFQFGPTDNQAISQFIGSDQNAAVSVISGAWAIGLFHSNQNFADIRKKAAKLQRIEARHLEILRDTRSRARVKIWSLAEFVEDPMQNLQLILDELGVSDTRLTEAPRMADLSGFGQFLQNLKNQGMSPYLMGEFPVSDDVEMQKSDQRPYVVR